MFFFLLCVHPVGSSSMLIQYLNCFKIQEKAQIYPREHERMQRSWQQLPPLHVCSLKGLQGAMKEKSMRQSGEPRAGCRVHPGVRVAKLSSWSSAWKERLSQKLRVKVRGWWGEGQLWRKSCRRGISSEMVLCITVIHSPLLHGILNLPSRLCHTAAKWPSGNQSFPT